MDASQREEVTHLRALYHGIHDMYAVVPTKLNPQLVKLLDRLVDQGIYLSRSEAIRDAIRRLVESHTTRTTLLRWLAEAASYLIETRFEKQVTDVILFGSIATGRASEEADVDLLVLTHDENDGFKLFLEVQNTIYPLALAADTLISTIVMPGTSFRLLHERSYSFAREVVKKGTQLRGDILNELRD